MTKDWSNRFIKLFVAGAMLAAFLTGTTVSAQNAVLEFEEQPAPVARFQKPAVPELLPMPGSQPGKQPQPIKPGEEPEQKFPMINPFTHTLPAPTLEAGEEGLVISLPAALRLANATAWDITIAEQQLQIAVAQLRQAQVLWLPTLLAGADYQYHSGPYQQPDGTMVQNSRSSLYAGGAPLAIFAITDAIFTPLAARQVARAQDANIQTSRNDTLTDLAQVYFDLLEAQADLASIMDVDQRAVALVKKTEGLSPGLVPSVELARVKALRGSIDQVVDVARQRWRNASAEVARIARLKPSVVLQPLEPPQMRVTLVPESMTLEQLIPIALAARPELTFYEAQAQAARQRARQEKWRPFLPTLIARGGGSTPPYPMAVGAFGGGTGTDLNNFAERSDWDVSAIWTLNNMGFGNLYLIRERNREYDLARSRQFRFRDVVAKEVVVAWSDIRSARARVEKAERELRQADLSAKQNLEGLGTVKRPDKAGQIQILIIRPQEVVQSLQALNQAYFDFYGVIAEYNRAQFRMYRSLGNPAQLLEGQNSLTGPLQNAGPQRRPGDGSARAGVPQGPSIGTLSR